MTLLDPHERSLRGTEQQSKLLGTPAPKAATLFESSWRDFIFAEVWTRPGLDLRSRYLVSVTSAATADTPQEILHGYIRGALAQDILSLTELREAALHFAIYGGWSRGAVIDAAISAVVAALGLREADFVPLRAARVDLATVRTDEEWDRPLAAFFRRRNRRRRR